MINDVKVEKITKFVVTCALLFSCIIIFIPKTWFSNITIYNNFSYTNTLFDETKVSEINIDISDEDWNAMLENPLEENYYPCTITLNGETLHNVGIRTKGNTSLSQVASSDSERYSFKIKFDKFVSGQKYNGLDMLNLNNIYADATYLKEYLSYDLFDYMGVTTPECSFSNITINNQTQGLYLAIEGLQNSYLERNYGTDNGNLYKAEGTGTDLVYTGENQSNYSGLKDNSVKDITDDDFQKIVDMIKNLNDDSRNLSDYIDINATLKYFAVSSTLVNLDSYQCNMYHNYYIYEKNGICTILPWDLNLAFGAFTGGGENKGQMDKNSINNPNLKEEINSLSNNTTSGLICYPIDEPTSDSMENSPLLSRLLEVDEYKEVYHEYLQQIVTEYFNNGLFKSKLYTTAELIDSYVKVDPTSFYGYDQFTNSIDELYNFGKYRAQSIALQLSGLIPSTKTDQSKINLSEYFSNDLVDMNMLGSIGGNNNKEGVMPNEHRNNQFNNAPSSMDNTFRPNENIIQPGNPSNKNKMSEDKNIPNKDDNHNKNLKTENATLISKGSAITFVICFISIIIALIFSFKFKRKKFRAN